MRTHSTLNSRKVRWSLSRSYVMVPAMRITAILFLSVLFRHDSLDGTSRVLGFGTPCARAPLHRGAPRRRVPLPLERPGRTHLVLGEIFTWAPLYQQYLVSPLGHAP